MKQEVYFKNIQSKIIELLESAEFDIKIAVAWFTDEKIIRVLNKKKKNGVNIEVVIYNDKINKVDLYFELVKSEVHFYKSSKLMHNKFCVIDEAIVINGSYNWTNNASSNNENITVIHSSDLVNDFLGEFNVITKSKFISKLNLSDYSKSNSYEFQADEILSQYQFPFFFKRKDEIKFIRNKNDLLSFFDRVKEVKYEQANKSLMNNYSRNWHDILFYQINGLTFDENEICDSFEDILYCEFNPYGTKGIIGVLKIDTNKYEYLNLFLCATKIGETYIKEYENWVEILNKNFFLKEKLNKKDYLILDEMFIYRKNGKYGSIDYNGNVKIPFNFDMFQMLEDKIEFKIYPLKVFYATTGKIERPTGFGGVDYYLYNCIKDSYSLQGFLLSSYRIEDGQKDYLINIFEINLLKFKKIVFDAIDQNDFLMNYEVHLKKLISIYGKKHVFEISKDNDFRQLLYVEDELKKNPHKYVIKLEKSSSCYIATLAYEDINHPKVELFRNFRDNYLVDYKLGRFFIKYYYKYSPSIVTILKPYKRVNKALRLGLDILLKLIPTNKND